jgi:hypothetical protein
MEFILFIKIFNQRMEKKEKIKKAAHILAGVLILFHSYERYETGHKSYIYFLIAGLIFLSIAIFHHTLKSKYPWIDSCFYFIEATLSLIIAYDYFHVGKKGLPFAYLFAGLFQLSAIYFLSKKKRNIK